MQKTGLDYFTLLGGPLHRMGRAAGLIDHQGNSVRLGLLIGGGLWLVLIVLAMIEGEDVDICALSMIGVHARLLLAIPLLFVCETIVDSRAKTFVETIARSEIVPTIYLDRLNRNVSRVSQAVNSWLPDAVCLLIAVACAGLSTVLPYQGTTAGYGKLGLAQLIPFATFWYLFICLTVFRFLVFRWLWRLGVWCHFLWRLSRFDLKLVPTHPDGSAGLGFLEVVHAHFIPLVLAISVVQSASLAEQIATGLAGFNTIYPAFAFVLVIDMALFIGPTLLFSAALWRARVKGLCEYAEFASSYAIGFDNKWLQADRPPEEPLLGTADIQSLADLANSINVVQNMRIVPVSLRFIRDTVIVAAVPFLPLSLIKFPVADLAEKFFTQLIGL